MHYVVHPVNSFRRARFSIFDHIIRTKVSLIGTTVDYAHAHPLALSSNRCAVVVVVISVPLTPKMADADHGLFIDLKLVPQSCVDYDINVD
ncbi:hypothetical protein MPTK2_4g90680P [Marchantia polymorpha subsp. ruderalis]